MPVFGVTGLPGSGKTLYSVRRCVKLLKRRPAAQLYTNVAIDHPRAHLIGFDMLMHPNPPPGIYLYDELPAGMDARRFQSVPDEMLNRWRQPRKVDWWVIWTAQTESMVDTRVRAVTKNVRRCSPYVRVPERRSRETDEITRFEHPLLVRVGQYPVGKADTAKRADLEWSETLLWPQLRPFAEMYDTTQQIELAAHLVERSERKRATDYARSSVDRWRTVPGVRGAGESASAGHSSPDRGQRLLRDRPDSAGLAGREPSRDGEG